MRLSGVILRAAVLMIVLMDGSNVEKCPAALPNVAEGMGCVS